MAKKRTKINKLWPILGTALIAAVVVVVVLETTNTTHIFHKSSLVSTPPTSAKSSSSSQSQTIIPKNPATQNSDVNQGTANDQNGQVPSGATTNPSQWTTSTSGLITLKDPTSNSTLSSGGLIDGSASNGPVQYRLVDDQAGVIAQGAINVVDGNFSAYLNFKPYASSGRLDVFNTDPTTGKEINEVQVNVNF